RNDIEKTTQIVVGEAIVITCHMIESGPDNAGAGEQPGNTSAVAHHERYSNSSCSKGRPYRMAGDQMTADDLRCRQSDYLALPAVLMGERILYKTKAGSQASPHDENVTDSHRPVSKFPSLPHHPQERQDFHQFLNRRNQESQLGWFQIRHVS